MSYCGFINVHIFILYIFCLFTVIIFLLMHIIFAKQFFIYSLQIQNVYFCSNLNHQRVKYYEMYLYTVYIIQHLWFAVHIYATFWAGILNIYKNLFSSLKAFFSSRVENNRFTTFALVCRGGVSPGGVSALRLAEDPFSVSSVSALFPLGPARPPG